MRGRALLILISVLAVVVAARSPGHVLDRGRHN